MDLLKISASIIITLSFIFLLYERVKIYVNNHFEYEIDIKRNSIILVAGLVIALIPLLVGYLIPGLSGKIVLWTTRISMVMIVINFLYEFEKYIKK